LSSAIRLFVLDQLRGPLTDVRPDGRDRAEPEAIFRRTELTHV